MKVREFHIRGFRSLKDTKVSGLTPKNIFYGENNSGKSNLLLILETIFQSKETGPGIFLDEDLFDENLPRHPTPFWQGYISDFSENFYMGGDDSIEFEVFLQVEPSFILDFDETGFLESLKEEGHDFRVKLFGRIERAANNGAMKLIEVQLNGEPAMQLENGSRDWLPNYQAPSDVKQRIVESVLQAFTDQVKIVPASRFLSEENYSLNRASLSSENYKNWLHSLSLSRDGYQTFKRVKNWLTSDNIRIGEISFVMENDRLELMVEDESKYRMRVDQKGSGIQQLLVLLGYIAESNSAIIAVEEPELNLSFRNQDLIVSILRDLVDNSTDLPHQILLTSHSDHIGSRGDLSRYHVEKKNSTDTVVRHFRRKDQQALFPRSR